MLAFGLAVLLGLAVLVVSTVVGRYLSVAAEFWAVSLVVLGMGAAWLANFDLFASWGLLVRSDAIGVTLTGFAIAGIGYFWREVLGFFHGLSRKFTDEAKTLEQTQNLRRVA